jgi:hypothetical protein
VTYNGVGMTLSDSMVNNGGPNAYLSLWYLINPATGTNNIIVTNSGAGNTVSACSASYTGASQTGVPDAHGTNSQASGSTSYTWGLTSIANNCWIVSGLLWPVTPPLTAGANTIVRQQPELVICGATLVDSNGPMTPAGTDNLNLSGPSEPWTFTAISATFAPAATPFSPLHSTFISQAVNRASTY